MNCKKYILFFCLIAISATAQDKKLSLSGYVSGMPSLIVQQPEGNTWGQILLHNRLNFGWQMSEHFRVDAGMRNRFIAVVETGRAPSLLNPESIGYDPGLFDLSWNWMNVETRRATSLLANTSFDRLNVTFEKNNWKLQAGRQRINWGQTFVSNPNDIFNTYSFFDFDYPERPGCDAFRTTYYHKATSLSELAVSSRDNRITAALLHRWNSNNIDYQLIAGLFSETDIVVGGALTSDYKGLNYRSELSYFHPTNGKNNGTIAVSVGGDYIFSNSLMLQTEILYNNTCTLYEVHSISSGNKNGLFDIFSASPSAKKLSFSDWNIFASASYPITPRLNGSLSGMYFVDFKSCYAGLSLDFSVIENLDFSFIAQNFFTIGNSAIGNMQMMMGFVRLKYSF